MIPRLPSGFNAGLAQVLPRTPQGLGANALLDAFYKSADRVKAEQDAARERNALLDIGAAAAQGNMGEAQNRAFGHGKLDTGVALGKLTQQGQGTPLLREVNGQLVQVIPGPDGQLTAKPLFGAPRGATPTDRMRNFEYAQKLPPEQRKLFLEQLGAGKTQINVGADENAFQKELGKQYAEQYGKTAEAAGTAGGTLLRLEQAEQALADPNLYTGTAGQAVQGLKSAAKTIAGLEVDGVGSGEVLDRVSKSLALDDLERLRGPASDRDVALVREMQPSLSKSAEGNALLIGLKKIEAQYIQDKWRIMEQYGADFSGANAAIRALDNAYRPQVGQIMNRIRSNAPEQRQPTAGTRLRYNIQTGELDMVQTGE